LKKFQEVDAGLVCSGGGAVTFEASHEETGSNGGQQVL
jgi:hypothetical protein